MVSDRAAYRGDIDGLRAVAVLLVIGFHFYPHHMPGGFVGVDVFFVVSGFLITRLVVAGLEDGSFNLADFFARRVRRIVPALALVVIVSLVAGWLLLFPSDYRDLGRHAAAAAAFIPNFALLGEAGYFDAASQRKPLLHLWAVGIGVQFTIVWPVVMLLAWRYRTSPFLVAIALFVVSFVWNAWLTPYDTVAAFYLPFTRFWELMLGSILAIASLVARDRGGLPARAGEALSLLGLALLIAGVVLIDRERTFPGWWALLPTLGTALLIFAGPAATLNRLVLNHRALVAVGLVSYPLYLWHWPLLAFARHVELQEPTDLAKAGYILVAFALAYLTYRYLEKPIRSGTPSPRTLPLLAAAMAAVGGIGLVVYFSNGFPGRFPGDPQSLSRDFRRDAEATRGLELCARRDIPGFAVTKECPPAAGRRLVVLWGDAHAAHLLRGLAEIERSKDDIQVVSFSHDGCPPILSYENVQGPDCPSVHETIMQRLWQLRPDTVIMAARWDQYDGSGKLDDQSIEWTIARLKSMGVRRVVGVGQFPVWDEPVPTILARRLRSLRASSTDAPLRDNGHLVQEAFAANYKIGRAFLIGGAQVVSPSSTLCNADGCLLTVPGTPFEPMTGDETHLTYAGSIHFVARNAAALTGN